MEQITQELIRGLLRPRAPESNKGTYGHALLCCGSARYRGAARLAAEGALRTGAGLVTLAATEKVLSAVLPALPECICLPLEEAPGGSLSAVSLPQLLQACDKASVLLLGCGLSQTEDTAALVKGVLSHTALPLVLDADGLNLLSALPPSHFERPAVLTPHPGEMARLCHTTVADVLAFPEATVQQLAARANAVVLLKLHRTLIALPDGTVYQNTTGNAGLARGGSGDALAGMITGLIARGYTPAEAVLLGTYLHGAAADACASATSEETMLPQDIFSFLPALFRM